MTTRSIENVVYRGHQPFVGGFEPKPSQPCEHEWDGPSLQDEVYRTIDACMDEDMGPAATTENVLAAIDRANAVTCKHCGRYRRFE